MKFLCDRCKTRYSIGDDRVRGKILKIRCKNCGNVITVREGMTADPEPEPSRHKNTTGAPDALDERRSAPAHGERSGIPSLPSVRGTGGAANVRSVVEGADAGRSAAGANPVAAAREASRGAGDDAALPRNAAPGANRGAAVAAAARDTAGRAGAGGPTAAGGAAVPGTGANRAAAAREAAAGGSGAGGANRGAARDSSSRIGAGAASSAARGAQVDTARGFGKPAQDARGSSAARGDAARAFGGDTAQGVGAAGGAARVQHESVNALNAAFASAMAQPAPAALEEEWYVSIDGDQAGPYSLAEAQRWVAQQPADAELHCWSEGFDDWLPIDKVSHFRGLRKRAAAPPPLPRVPSGPARPGLVAPQPPEETPKPLFAATMASLERAAPPASNGANGLPASVPVEAKPDAAPAAAAKAKSAQPLFGDPFDASEDGDAATQLEAVPFEMAARAAAAKAAEAGPSASDAALTAPQLPASSTLQGAGASPAATAPAAAAVAATPAPASPDFGGDDDLHIGEVSRVVKLADIARSAQSSDRVAVSRTTGMNPTMRTTGAAPAFRTTGATSSLRATGALPSQLDGAAGDGGVQPAIAPVVRSHRRGLIALLVVAIALVVGVIGAVVLFVTTDDDLPGSSLGPVQSIDTLRPEDPVTHRPVGSAAPAPTTSPALPRGTPHPRPVPNTGGSSQIAENPGPPVGALASDEIEDAARKHQEMTQRCYMRSQRGADAILIGEVKKIAVTLTIDRDGNVSELQLSDHAGDNLGKCLAGAIKAWKFRQSAGGTYRFSLNFVSG